MSICTKQSPPFHAMNQKHTAIVSRPVTIVALNHLVELQTLHRSLPGRRRLGFSVWHLLARAGPFLQHLVAEQLIGRVRIHSSIETKRFLMLVWLLQLIPPVLVPCLAPCRFSSELISGVHAEGFPVRVFCLSKVPFTTSGNAGVVRPFTSSEQCLFTGTCIEIESYAMITYMSEIT